ncbi:hypothetical protein HPP92_001171 [Vanilla planifolia]|uniref:Uncharacterized protein n=1 Tax=Vanilla planifolia TaxID=51239 RepID=A0A835VGT3_VANPL|nr:hypothetical protein HPP92_001171 [Vanilla planifolia]
MVTPLWQEGRVEEAENDARRTEFFNPKPIDGSKNQSVKAARRSISLFLWFRSCLFKLKKERSKRGIRERSIAADNMFKQWNPNLLAGDGTTEPLVEVKEPKGQIASMTMQVIIKHLTPSPSIALEGVQRLLTRFEDM